MAVITRFSDGQILDINLNDGGETLACISSQAKNIRHCMVVFSQGQLQVFKFMRKTRRVGPVRSLLNEIEENLLQHYKFPMKGLIWGQPAITKIDNRWVWMLNEIMIIDERGLLCDSFKLVLDRYGIVNADSAPLLDYFNSTRNQTSFQM